MLDLSDVSFVGGLLDCMGLTGVRRERVLDLLAQKNVPGIRGPWPGRGSSSAGTRTIWCS